MNVVTGKKSTEVGVIHGKPKHMQVCAHSHEYVFTTASAHFPETEAISNSQMWWLPTLAGELKAGGEQANQTMQMKLSLSEQKDIFLYRHVFLICTLYTNASCRFWMQTSVIICHI